MFTAKIGTFNSESQQFDWYQQSSYSFQPQLPQLIPQCIWIVGKYAHQAGQHKNLESVLQPSTEPERSGQALLLSFSRCWTQQYWKSRWQFFITNDCINSITGTILTIKQNGKWDFQLHLWKNMIFYYDLRNLPKGQENEGMFTGILFYSGWLDWKE